MNLRKNTSSIWEFFVIDPNDSSKAQCNKCETKIVRGSETQDFSTTPLTNHLRRKHPEKFKEFEGLRKKLKKKKKKLKNNQH